MVGFVAAVLLVLTLVTVNGVQSMLGDSKYGTVQGKVATLKIGQSTGDMDLPIPGIAPGPNAAKDVDFTVQNGGDLAGEVTVAGIADLTCQPVADDECRSMFKGKVALLDGETPGTYMPLVDGSPVKIGTVEGGQELKFRLHFEINANAGGPDWNNSPQIVGHWGIGLDQLT